MNSLNQTIKNTGSRVRVAVIAMVAIMVLAACSDGNPTSQTQESQRQQGNYDLLVTRQPAAAMDYSPTREAINKWIELWDEPGKLSYVYMQAANGQLFGYYVLEGLPVSYCALLTPTYMGYDFDGDGNDDEDVIVQAPSIDGVYYSGGQCNQYYGWDAVTGGYLEWSVGDGINYLLYDQPLARQDVDPLGYTVIGDDGELVAVGD